MTIQYLALLNTKAPLYHQLSPQQTIAYHNTYICTGYGNSKEIMLPVITYKLSSRYLTMILKPLLKISKSNFCICNPKYSLKEY